jgi:hypothetical protein
MKKLEIKTGDKFGRLTIIKELEPRGKNKYRYFECECECGTIRDFKIYRLTGGITISCGCYGREVSKALGYISVQSLKEFAFPKGHIPANFIDGDNNNIKKTDCYYITRLWQGIKQRCYNRNEPGYKWYGADGIKMYEPWINDRQLFKKWILDNIGHRPEGYSIDRIDFKGNYEPGNLRWADKKTQSMNRRNVKKNA